MNDVEKSVKNLFFLVAAGVLILVGIFTLIGIIQLTIGLIFKAIPLLLLAGGIYLVYRWWQGRYQH